MENFTPKEQRQYDILKEHSCVNEYQNWMNYPFSANGKTLSTDGNMMIAFPEFIDGAPVMNEKIRPIFPKEANIDIQITVSDMKSIVESAPLIDCYDEVEKECSACCGEGEVEYEFSHDLRDYMLDHECPVCEGEGTIGTRSSKPNGKKEIDPICAFKIDKSFFSAKYTSVLIDIADKLAVTSITLYRQDTMTSPSYFKIGTTDVLLMPIMIIEEECKIIKLTP